MGRTLHAAAAGALAFAMLCDASVLPEPAPSAGQRAQSRAGTRAALVPARCPGRAITPTRVITGKFGTELARSFVMLPFEVPRGTTAVRVKVCHDQPDVPVSTPLGSARHTLDLGLYGPRRDPSGPWGTSEFRGWGGSSHPDATVSAEGFSSEAQYSARPRIEPAGKTTRAFRPGRIRPGRWAVELGVAAVVPRTLGDLDGKVGWRVEIELADDPRFADEPYRPAAYDSTPARRQPGWFAGDLHVHAEHSAYGDATMREVFDYAFRPLGRGGAGLDFVNLSDYVSGGSWGEIGRHQGRYPGKQVIRSAEVITYRGHLKNHNTARVVDYREGPVLERRADGSLARMRGSRPPAQTFDDIKRQGGYTQINHPTIFPSKLPLFDLACRGCSWEFTPRETGYGRADAIEVATGPPGVTPVGAVPNPFTLTAIDFYERALRMGARPAAVGVSDSHNAGRTNNPLTQSPIGVAATVVRAEELSEPGIECGVEAGHTYVKVTGNAGPDLRLEARPPGHRGAPAIFGDTVRAGRASFEARVLDGTGRALLVIKDGRVLRSVGVRGRDFSYRFGDAGPGRYRLQLVRGAAVDTVSSPIYLEPGPGTVVTRDCSPLRVRGNTARRIRPSRRGSFLTRCTAWGGDLRQCAVTATIRTGRPGRRRTRTLGTGRARMSGGSRRVRVRLNRAGRAALRRRARGIAVRLTFTADDGDGATARAGRRVRLLRR